MSKPEPEQIMARAMQDAMGHWRRGSPIRPIYSELAIAAVEALEATGYLIALAPPPPVDR